MFLLAKKIHLRCAFRPPSIRSIFLFVPFAAFLFLVVTYLKQGLYISRWNGSQNSEKVERIHENYSLAFPFVNEFKPKSWKWKKYDNEDARLVGFPVKDSTSKKSRSTKIIYLATKFFNEWNPRHFYFFHTGNATFLRYSCAIDACYVTKKPSDIDRADAVLFHLRDLEVYSLPQKRSPNQVWIIYSMEPPWLEVKDMKRFNGIFNWTMSYRRDSDVLVKYGFIGRRPHTEAEFLFSKDIFQHKENRAIWFVSNCRTDSNRERYIERLMKIYPVDIVGGCGKQSCRPPETGKCYNKVAASYKFYLAFENAICRDYVTEKLFNPLGYNIVPVVLGGANYSRIVPENSVIDAMQFSSPEDLGQYLWKVSRNETLYFSYFSWKSTYRSYLQPWMCDLCEKLHSPAKSKTHYHLEKWWHEDESCLTWTIDDFKPINKHPFPVYNVKLFD